MSASNFGYLRTRRVAVLNVPENIQAKPDRFLVAVVPRAFSDTKSNRFLWITAKPTKSIKAVQRVYNEKRPNEPIPTFKLDNHVVHSEARLWELNFFHDFTIVLTVDSEQTADGSSAGMPSSTAGPAFAGSNTATQFVAAPTNLNGIAVSCSPGSVMQLTPAMTMDPSPSHSRQLSVATPTHPSSTLPGQNGIHYGAGTFNRQAHLSMDSPNSSSARTPAPTHTSRARVTSAGATQPVPTAASPFQPFRQHFSPHSPFRPLPTLQQANGYPGTPANAQGCPIHVYGNAPANLIARLEGGSYSANPPMKHRERSPTVYNHGNRSASFGLIPESTRPDPAPQPEDKHEPQNHSLQTLTLENDLEYLEAGAKQALKLLEKIGQLLEVRQEQQADAKEWLKSIDDLKNQNMKNKTILGVVGNTGAGKSSIINALLDEERLVPTNCMRACTAVVTEVSWNDSNEHRSRYRAEIEFIKYDDWLRELQVLYNDILDASGNVTKDSSNSDSEAGVAWAKIKAVYPQKTKDMIAEATPERLAREVQGLLGTTRQIKESDAGDFYKRLQYFVDSQEKVKDGKEKKTMDFWPLIKVVKIYTKAEALSTGAVVVDLPGVQDSNAARAAVAEGYMKQCSGLWIVAPITRAVDDKAAKKLLGDTFKRQLKLDGTYDNVTFICSKTDDISLQNAVSGLNLDKTASGMWSELDDIRSEIKTQKNKLEQLKKLKAAYLDAFEDCDEKLDVWDKLLNDYTDGKVVYGPNEKKAGEKKKRSASPAKRSKKRHRADELDEDFIDDDDDDDADAESDAAQNEPEEEFVEHREPLTQQQIAGKIQVLKYMKKEAKSERDVIDDQMKEIRKEIKELTEQEAETDDEISRLCIKGRNEYSRGAIKQDFAAGIRELDQETAEEENAEELDPEANLRDYEEVARSLPVFCVSSRAYQKLCGRLKQDSNVPGFKDVSETEVPQLQAHCKQLTEAGRSACARRFLNNLNQFLTLMNPWVTVRRNGVYSGASGPRDFNAELTAPILKEIATDWERAFQRRLTINICAFKSNVSKELESFHNTVCQRAGRVGVSMARLDQLNPEQNMTSIRRHRTWIPMRSRPEPTSWLGLTN